MNLLGAIGANRLESLSTSGNLSDTTSGAAQNAAGSDSLENNFLKMLTTELRNQDPTKPMDSTEMVTQLSQISTSEGINNLEKLSRSEIMALLSTERLESSDLIGKNVDYSVNHLDVTDAKSQYAGTVQAPDSASGNVDITIKNSDGDVVKKISVPLNADHKCQWQWDGTDENGKHVASGNYSISATVDGSPVNVLQSASVKKVNFTADGKTELLLDNGETTDISAVVSMGE